MRHPLLLLLATLAALNASAQNGYLGRKNQLSLGVNDRLWADAWSVSYLRTLGAVGEVRMDLRILGTDRDLYDPGSGWLGIGNEDPIGTVEGSGFGFGVHVYMHPSAGLGAPLGYFMAYGLEFSQGKTTEAFDSPVTLRNEGATSDTTVSSVDYEHSVIRFVYTWGVRKVITGNVTLDLGAEIAIVFKDKVTTDGIDLIPRYRFPFERVGLGGELTRKAPGDYRSSVAATMQPVLRIGYLF